MEKVNFLDIEKNKDYLVRTKYGDEKILKVIDYDLKGDYIIFEEMKKYNIANSVKIYPLNEIQELKRYHAMERIK